MVNKIEDVIDEQMRKDTLHGDDVGLRRKYILKFQTKNLTQKQLRY